MLSLAHSLLVAAAVASPPLTVATGVLTPPLPGEPAAAARRYVESRRDELGLPLTSTLGAPAGFSTRFGGALHFPQLVNGLPIYGAKVIVTLDRQQRVYVLSSSVVPYQRAVLRWDVSAARAQELAAERTPLARRDGSGAPLGGFRRVLFPAGDEVHAGYLVHVPSLDPRQSWFVAVDATTGQILWARNKVFYAANDAQVYARSPGGLDAGVGRAPLTNVQVEHLLADRDGGYLEGDQLTAYNCCPTEDCKPDAGSKRSTGSVAIPGFGNIPYNIAICQRLQRASQDVNVHDAGNYMYEPVDPATPKQVLQDGTAIVDVYNPANSDPFVEVQAYYQVNKVYDFMKELSLAAKGPFNLDAGFAPFQTRDAKLGKKSAVWTNVTLPNVNEAISSMTLPLRANTLTHTDNAAFIAKENFDQFRVDAYSLDVDTLMIFQGTNADFGYDAPVLWHEFGHGVIHATAAFESFTIDSRSGNNEGGALHEGIADFIAGAYGQDPRVGEYVGPRLGAGEGNLRELTNAEKCPNVLWGEVHQDSQHFSGALWSARTDLFQGTDQGRTFDAAIYAALVSMTPSTGFVDAAAIVSAQMPIAFPGIADAQNKMKEVFAARGVTGCSKVVDVTGSVAGRKFYGIGGTQEAGLAGGTLVPGPHQFRMGVSTGAKSLTVKATLSGGAVPGGPAPAVILLAKDNQPITFTPGGGNSLTHDAKIASGAAAAGMATLTVPIAVPCGGAVFFTLGNTSTGAATLTGLTYTVEPADSCPVDAGTPEPDAGPPYIVKVPTGEAGLVAPGGCGCQSAGGAGLAALGLLGLGALAARRRRS